MLTMQHIISNVDIMLHVLIIACMLRNDIDIGRMLTLLYCILTYFFSHEAEVCHHAYKSITLAKI